MSTPTSDSLVVLDGKVSDEKLAELLGLQTEHPMLDFKSVVDLTGKPDLVELAKDVGAFQVFGGYIIGGVDGHGIPNGRMDGCDARLFDSANLVPQLAPFLPEPLTIHSRVTEWKGHTVVILFIAPHQDGYAVFKSVGQYPRPGGKKGEMRVVFREGEIFWRDGTRSVRISQQGLREVIARRVAAAKAEWMEEQQELRRRDREELEAGYAGRELAKAPLGAMNLGLSADELRVSALELVRANDQVGLLYLLNDARPRAASAIERDEIETELADLLDKLACLAATFLEYQQEEWFDRIVGVLAQIYSLPLGENDARRFGYATHIDPREKAPRVWLLIIERVYALGALAARLGNWDAVRTLTLQLPERLDHSYDANWLRHALTMASRARHLDQQQGDRTVHLSLLSLAQQEAQRLTCLRLDGLAADDDALTTSFAQFDFLSNLAAIDGAGLVDPRVFFPNFARFYQHRIQPLADRMVEQGPLRDTIFPRGDEDLAIALAAVGKSAREEGIRYAGFESWNRTPVGEFIAKHQPQQS